MTKNFLPFVLILFAFPSVGWSMDIASKKVTDSIKIDGKMNDWDSIPTVFFEDEAVAMGIANDSANLYILCRFQNPMWASTIRSGGLTFKIKSKDKKQNEMTIKYTDGPSMAEMMGQLKDRFGGDRQMPMDNAPTNKKRDRKPQLLCTVKDYLAEKELPLDGSEGPAAAYDTSMGFYVYEFCIPLTECRTTYYGIPNLSAKPLEITAVWGEMDDDRQGKGPGGMSGGPPGGGMGGGLPGGGMSGQKMQRPEKQELKLKIKLAE